MQFSNQQVAQVFRDIADTMEVLGENRFKYQAYSRAADALDGLPVSLYDYLEAGTLGAIPGVGPAISAKIIELLATGTMQFRERLRAQVPDGVLEVVRVPGVGPKTALRLYHELGIADVGVLEQAARAGRIRALKGLGAKLETRILDGLATRVRVPDRFLLGEMLPLARELVATFQSAAPMLAQLSYAGSLRRATPTVGNIDLVAAAAEPDQALNAFAALPHVALIETMHGGIALAQLHNGKQCSLHVALPEAWGAVLALRSGSAAHRARLQLLATERGLELDDRGLVRNGVLVPSPTEEAFYAALGLPCIPPELREDWGEIEAAQSGRLPQLIELRDLRADMHTHTEWSDGRGTVAEMAAAAVARGYEYYVITDHSFYMGMVNGLDAARLKQQRAEIDAANADFQRRGIDFRLLQGCEVDLLPDGTLALPDEVLATLDWVVASLHVGLRQERDLVTQRVLNAIRNPHVDCVGHLTGRKLLRREAADLDLEAIFEAAAATGTVLEVDGAYERLDIDAALVKRALAMGIRIVIDSDAHRPTDLPGIEYGVLTARRGWASRANVVNCWPWEQIRTRRD